MPNANLHQAKRAKADEFYTRYEDIEREIEAYVAHNPDVFRDQTVLLPCDDPDRSQFVRYFLAEFDRLGLRRLIATCWVEGGYGRILDTDYPERTHLRGDGDFRSDEVTALRDLADAIVTNPPFSLWREFFVWANAGS